MFTTVDETAQCFVGILLSSYQSKLHPKTLTTTLTGQKMVMDPGNVTKSPQWKLRASSFGHEIQLALCSRCLFIAQTSSMYTEIHRRGTDELRTKQK